MKKGKGLSTRISGQFKGTSTIAQGMVGRLSPIPLSDSTIAQVIVVGLALLGMLAHLAG